MQTLARRLLELDEFSRSRDRYLTIPPRQIRLRPISLAEQAAGNLPLPPATYYGVLLPGPDFVPAAGLPVQAAYNQACALLEANGYVQPCLRVRPGADAAEIHIVAPRPVRR